MIGFIARLNTNLVVVVAMFVYSPISADLWR